MSNEVLAPQGQSPDDSRREVTNVYHISVGQKALLSPEALVCLVLASDDVLHETLYAGTSLNLMLADETGLKSPERKTGIKKRRETEDEEGTLAKVIQHLRKEGYVEFERFEFEEEEFVEGKERPIINTESLIKASLTDKGKDFLDKQIRETGLDRDNSNGDVANA